MSLQRLFPAPTKLKGHRDTQQARPRPCNVCTLPCRDNTLQPLAAQCWAWPELGLNPGLQPLWQLHCCAGGGRACTLPPAPCPCPLPLPLHSRGLALSRAHGRGEERLLQRCPGRGARPSRCRRAGLLASVTAVTSWPWALQGSAGGMQATECCTAVPPAAARCAARY